MAEILFLYNGKEILQKCLKDEKKKVNYIKIYKLSPNYNR